MGTCDVCGKAIGLPFQCDSCGGTYCGEHRLPENHGCVRGNPHWGSFDEGAVRKYEPRSVSTPQTQLGAFSWSGWLLVPFVIAFSILRSGLRLFWRLRWVGVGLVLIGAFVVALGPASIGGKLPGTIEEDINNELKSVVESVQAFINNSTSETDNQNDNQDNAGIQQLNTAAIEQAIHKRINEIRADRGLPTLYLDRVLSSQAAEHSVRMAEFGSLFHGDLSRYSCSVAVGENVAYTYAYADVQTESGIVDYDGNETAIGYGLVRAWMNSPGHRDNILSTRWESTGIGIEVVEVEGRVRVYATQVFCGS